MSRSPRRRISFSSFTSTQRVLIIASICVLALSGVAVTKSLGLGEKLRLLGGARASSTSAAPSFAKSENAKPVARDHQKIDLLRLAGISRAPLHSFNVFSPLAPTVTATKTDALFTDVDGDLQADPGDTLEYTVTINAAGEDATGVTFTDTVDPNTAFVGGSLTATPVAVNDTYSATGNIRISIAAPGVRGNDYDGVPSATISSFDATSANGGDVTMNNDGSFTYNPPAGFEGADTFTYTLTNSAGSNNATVTVNVSGMIWFIDNSASCPCDGRLTNPFNSLASFAAVNIGGGNNPDVNDNIFVYESATDYVGPVTLLNGQKFIGQDASASLSSITGLTPPAGSDPLPTTNSGNAVIVNITSATNSIVVAMGNLLTGFTGGNSATDIFGTGFGTLTVSDVILNGTGQAVDLTNGALAATFISISSTGGTNGIELTNTTGSFTVVGDGSLARNGSGGTITATLDDGVALTNATNVTLQSMNLTNNGNLAAPTLTDAQTISGDHAVQISGGSGITLSGVLIQNPSTSGILALNLGGTNSVNSDSLITALAAGSRHGIYVNNVNTNMSAFNFHDSAMRDFSSSAIAFFFTNSGTSNMTLDVEGSTFEDLAVQAIAASGGGAAGTTGTLTTFIGGPSASDRNFFQNAKSSGENNAALLVANGATHVGTIENNVFDNVAENGSIANTSIIRTQNSGGKMTAVVEDNVVQNITYAVAGRHVIGHIFEPIAFNAANFSDLRFEGNTASVTYTGTNREFAHIDYRASASGGDIKILNNNFTLTGADAQEIFELRFRTTNASTIDLLVDGNTGTGNTTSRFLDIDSEAAATVNSTVTNNNFTNTHGTPGQSIDFASETATASLCANVSGNTLSPNTITLNEIAGNMTVTQASAAAVAAANGGATVTVGGTPTFGAPACSLPMNAMMAAPSKTGAVTLGENESILYAERNEGPGDNNVTQLSQSTLYAIVHSAIARWEEAGASPEGLAKLRSISVDVADLPVGQLASANSSRIVFDQSGAGYGWFYDLSPGDDLEFELPVLTKQREALGTSAAHGQMDLLTAVMQQLGSLLSSDETQAHKWLMQNTLAPSVRRTPARRVTGKAAPAKQVSPIAESVVAQAAQPKSITYPQLANLNQRMKALRHHAMINPRVAAAMLADVTLSIGTLPAGESVTIKFRVTIDDPFGGAMAQVSNQGTVSGSNFADVLTDDPSVGGAADPTVTPIDLPDVTVAVAPASVAEDGATNLVYTFTRTGSTANSMTVNFSVGGTASFTEPDYTQTGAATFTATNGTVVIPSGSSTASVTVDPSADTTVEPDETVDLTVTSGVGYTPGAPSSASGTITNDDTDVTVAVAPGSVSEDGATNLVYTFTRNGVTTNSLTVDFTVGGSAVFPADYSQSGAATFTAVAGTVTFLAGSSTAQVTIDPVADAFIEGDETVTLTVIAGVGYNVGTPSSATGTITNDDAEVTVAVSPASVTEDGATNLTYTFTRTGFTALPLVVNYTIGGTATFGASPNDYTQTGATTFTPPTGTITFGAGSSTAILTIDPETDATAEPDETVDITLAPGLGYTVGTPSSATGTILNDDTVVSVAVSPLSTAEGGANLVYTFTRTGSTGGALTVNFSVGGTASFPADYSQTGATTFTPPTATVTFGAGNSTATVTVTPLTDCMVEGSETVEFTVTPGTGYGVGSPSTATGTITNTPDTTAPVITLIPNVNMTLWPPDHNYETVEVSDFVSGATDNCDGPVDVYILKIHSDEVEDGAADGSTLNDIVIANDCESAQLRAERSGAGNGRVYTITFKAVDSAGNFSTATAQVTVKLNPGTPAVDSGAAYTVNSVCP
jgi:hypothetical protein